MQGYEGVGAGVCGCGCSGRVAEALHLCELHARAAEAQAAVVLPQYHGAEDAQNREAHVRIEDHKAAQPRCRTRDNGRRQREGADGFAGREDGGEGLREGLTDVREEGGGLEVVREDLEDDAEHVFGRRMGPVLLQRRGGRNDDLCGNGRVRGLQA